jgi:hypothetical protein
MDAGMDYSELGRTGVMVSRCCLGTMTWGSQNSEEEAHAQMDYALERGVNFWDTAEMYSSPPDPKTQGNTERHIGSWLKKTGKRDEIVLASKVAGRGSAFGGLTWMRSDGAPTRHTKAQIDEAVGKVAQAPQHRLSRPLPAALARPAGAGVRRPDLQGLRAGLRDLRRHPRGAGRPREEGDRARHRRLQRVSLGRDALPGRERKPRPAAHRLDPERLSPGQPHLRIRPGRDRHARKGRICWPIRRWLRAP